MPSLNLLGLNTSTTCSKLHDLHKELNQQNQGATEAYGRPLLNQLLKLLDNKDKQVRILNCCCLADIFRIYAPEAPFNEKEFIQIFSSFFKQLVFIKDPAGPLFPYYFYLLETISTIKCVCLLAQLQSADDLISQVFHDFFDIISPDMTMTLHVCMRDVLFQLIEEFNFVSQSVIQLIVTSFSEKTQKSNPSAFKLAVDLSNMCDDKLQRYVCQYFGDVMIAASKNLDDDEDALDEFEKTHHLIMEIFEHVPSLLLNVVPQLEEELKVETIGIRQLASHSLGMMFAKKGSKWVDTYPHIFKTWCDRRHDKIVQIRVEWVEITGEIVSNHPDMTQTMEPMLKSKLMDPDEKVRVAAIKAIGIICKGHPNILDDETFNEVAARCRDKKFLPRSEAIEVLSKVFHNVYNLSLQASEAPLERFMWIPGLVLELLYLDDKDTRIIVEKVFIESIFPPNLDHNIRTTRLLRVLSKLNEKQYKAFLSIVDRQVKAINAFTVFLDQCVKFNSGGQKGDAKVILDKVIDFLSGQLPEPKKAEAHLKKFVELKDGRLCKLIRAVMDPVLDFKLVAKHTREISGIISKHGGIQETLNIFLRRITLNVVNKNLLDVLLGLIKAGTSDMHKVAETLLKDISRIFPALFQTNTASFVAVINNPDSKTELVDDTVEALAKFVKEFPQSFTSDPELKSEFPALVRNLVNMCISGTATQAESAALILAKTEQKKECQHVLKTIVPSLNLDFATLVPKLACLKYLAFYYNSIYEPFAATIMQFIVSQVLMKNVKIGNGRETEWTPYESLEDEGKAKILALQIVIKPLLIQSDSNRLPFAKSAMKLCRKLLAADGELMTSGDTWAPFKTHLRLNAGLAAIDLLAHPEYAEAFEPDDYNKIGLLVQDPIYFVRNTFVDHLIQSLTDEKIDERYAMWLTLAAHEPENSLKMRVKSALMRMAKVHRSQFSRSGKKLALLESRFSHFAQLLSHHPDFSMDHEDLELFEVYVQFYLSSVATDENISFLYASAAQLKMVKDKHLEDSTPLYVIAEMLILRIREYSAQQNWTLHTYSGKFSIARDFYDRLDEDAVSANLKTVFYKDGEKMSKPGKRQATASTRSAAITQEEEEDDDASSGDSDSTQVLADRKRMKLSPKQEPSRRSERAKKPLVSTVIENSDSEIEN